MSCPREELPSTGQDCFFCPDGIHWDAHRTGWAVAGGCAAATTLITLFTLTMHATHYQQPAAQRQVMRVLMMPAVYAIVSFFSYRYYQEYEYYVLAETAYEAITLSAFLMLLMELVALRTSENDIRDILKDKDKRKLPFPFGCWRFRASKPYFMHTLTFSVLQYVVIRPAITIAGIICEYFNVLCTGTYSPHFAGVYLEAIDFASISVALYGLIVFYVLCKDELKGRRPLSKFLAIKLIVFFVFYQTFVFSVLKHYGVIKATEFWTADNVSNGLSALATTIEMVLFSAYMGWAYSWKEYTSHEMNPNQRPINFKTYLCAIWDTINLSDFAIEIWSALKFFTLFMLGRPGTHSQPTKLQKTFMPHTIEPHEKLPMESMQPMYGPRTSAPRRSPSGNLIQDLTSNESNPYQTLDAQGNAWRPSEDGSPQLDPQHPFAKPTAQPSSQWGDSYTNLRYNGSAPPIQTHSFPDPHPYGNGPNLAPPVSSPSRVAYPTGDTAAALSYRSYGGDPSTMLDPNRLDSGTGGSFPSPHPTGLHPPNSARSVQTIGSRGTESGSSHYATPMATPGDYREADQPWPGDLNKEQRPRPESGVGLPGNPKLY